MGLLRLAVLGPPEIFHDSSRLTFSLRKAQALLLYLAIEGGMHPRSKLAAFLWPDSESSDARRTLRNAMVLLRSLLADPNPAAAPDSLSPGQGTHLLSQGDLIGLNPQAPLELDLAVVQQALALVRGPFLEGFWLREETAFDTWHEQQQQQWQVRLLLLCDRLSSWQEAAGELEPARATLLRWLALDPLAEEAIHCLEASLALYAALDNEPTASRELPLPSFAIGAPLTQPLTYRASEAMCWAVLAFAQVNGGQVQHSLRSGRLALALSQEIKNVWAHILSTLSLTQGLLDAGEYEEALVLIQHAVELARTLPLTVNFPRLLTVLGSVYQAVQRWEEARAALEEAVAVAERLGLGPLRVPVLSQLCMHYVLAGEWEAAYRYAVQAIVLRKRTDAALIAWDFYPQYETEALLRGGDERQAREAVHRLGERLGPYRRFRLPYLRSEAALAAWDGQREQATSHLREAVQLAADLGLPAERWQIQAALGSLYQAGGEQELARTAFGEAARIIQGLAEGIGDEARRSRFLAGPQIHQVMQYAHRNANEAPKDHAEQREL